MQRQENIGKERIKDERDRYSWSRGLWQGNSLAD